MSRDLPELMQETAAGPERRLDLDDLWRRGRRRRWAKRAGAVLAAAAVVVGLAVVVVPAVAPVPPVLDAPPADRLRILQAVEVAEPGRAVAAADRVWVTSYQGPLRWIDPTSGRTGQGVVTSGSCGLGEGADLLVVFRCEDPVEPDGELVAIEPEDGSIRWTARTHGFVTSMTGSAGRVLALAQTDRDAWLASFDAATGEELARLVIERASVWDVVADGERAWITAARQPDPADASRRIEVIAVDVEDLSVVDRRTVGDDLGVPQRLARHDGELWLPLRDRILVLDTDSLEEVGAVPWGPPSVDTTSGPTIETAQGTAWVVHANGVVAVDTQSRSIIGQTDLGLRVTAPPAIHRGRLWVPDRQRDRVVAVGW